jgi:hypothetical protein
MLKLAAKTSRRAAQRHAAISVYSTLLFSSGERAQSAFAPDSFTTLAHLVISLAW